MGKWLIKTGYTTQSWMQTKVYKPGIVFPIKTQGVVNNYTQNNDKLWVRYAFTGGPSTFYTNIKYGNGVNSKDIFGNGIDSAFAFSLAYLPDYTQNESYDTYIISDSIIKKDGKYKFTQLTAIPYSYCVIPFKCVVNDKSYKYLYFKSNISNSYLFNDDNIPNFPEINHINLDTVYYLKNNDIIYYNSDNIGYPPLLSEWFNNNFIFIYENTYTIKSVAGETLSTLTEAPPMISATLSSVGNAKYLTLKGENDTNYTMEWTSETPQGKIFAGLATSKGGSIVIPVGETSTINLTDSADLYEVWQTYRPPTTTFEIKTYNYSGETSRIDKTDYLTPISTLSGVLRGESSLLNFNVLIQSDTVPNFNYCYIDKFKRYYYVTEPVSVRQNLWEIIMQVDVLMTYKDSLLKCEGYIDRNEYIQNKMIIDNNRAIMQGADFEEDTITNELFGSGSFVLSGLRIGTKEK